ncbi:hypothetical protein [Halorubrum distributum]|uniref:hypothetical protein n=1 Tax=Halorubrum distributum TaxID=29283 RepID=UPI0012679868|nr:hypothetical protein [Halorubrum terrestre]
MPNGILQIFGSYDLFGKSLPGALLTLGIISLFPLELISTPEVTSVLNLALLVVLLLFVGLMIGQGVHTLADNIEKAMLWFAIRTRNIANLLRSILNISPRADDFKFDIDPDANLLLRFLAQGWDHLIEWIRRRFWGTFDSLVGHRYLLAKSIEWNFNPEARDKRWGMGEKGEIYDLFAESYTQQFDADIRQRTPSEIRTQYPLITGSLSNDDGGEFRTFQSTYSFCRSMWVVFLVLTIIYTALVFGPNIHVGPIDLTLLDLPYEPSGLELIPDVFHEYLPISLLVGTGVFFDASGTYKRHFVEYLISDFAVSFPVRTTENDPN